MSISQNSQKQIFASQNSPDYQELLVKIKHNIETTRHLVFQRVNSSLVGLYYEIGRQIVEKQKLTSWGDNLIGQIEIDLKKEFPKLSGFSRSNLFYMKKLFVFFGEGANIPQPVGQIPWGHIRLVLDRIKDRYEADFYLKKTLQNSWSRTILDHQIDLDLYKREGNIQNNFVKTVDKKDLDLLKNSFKENYVLDFLGMTEDIKERKLEQLLVDNISNFILEMGKGFAFVGKQYKITVDDKEFFIDLLFYNFILKRFIVIELKTTEFKPEYLGQIGFYLTTIDKNVKTESDKDSIGLIICKNKNKTIVEYALQNFQKPTGVAEYKLAQIPSEIAEYLPNEEDIQNLTNK